MDRSLGFIISMLGKCLCDRWVVKMSLDLLAEIFLTRGKWSLAAEIEHDGGSYGHNLQIWGKMPRA